MEPIKIKGTTDTPKVECDPNGTITLSGKSLTEDPLTFFKPIIEWVSNLTVGTITFDIQLDYMNTSCSKEIYNLLKAAKDNQYQLAIIVNWICEASDEDSFEIGKEFESMLEIPFNIKQM